MRRRHQPSKVVPTGVFLNQDAAALKIQSIFRGRKTRQQSSILKLNTIATFFPMMRRELTQLKSKVALLESDVQKKQQTSNPHTSAAKLLVENEYKISGSMWDVVLVIGTKHLGSYGSIFSSILLFMNITIQFVFCYIVLGNFTKEAYDDNTILGFRSWRRNIAHSADFMEDITEVSLASRICGSDSGLELSGSQAISHQWLMSYLNGNGALMCVITVIMWLLTVAKELSSVISFWNAILILPQDTTTRLSEDGSTFVSLSKFRYVVVLSITLCRFMVVILLGYAGTAWLANTVSVTDLILNAVALEFVLCVDEIIYEALAPKRLKSLVEHFESSPLPLPPINEWKGLDSQGLSMLIGLICIMIITWFGMIAPFEYRLKLADDALCAGELDFVYTVSKTGIPAWSKSSSYKDSDGEVRNGKSYGTGQWMKDSDIHEKDRNKLGFSLSVVDNLINGYGMNRVPDDGICGNSIYFQKVNQTVETPFCAYGICEVTFCEAQSYVGLIDINGQILESYNEDDLFCCVAQQIKTPNLKGGKLSLSGVQSEDVSTATDVWNPGCFDELGTLDPIQAGQDPVILPFSNLLAGSLSDVFGGTCGICPSHIPYCDPILNECMNISCRHMEENCFEDSTAGVRARQFCPITCGCHNPSDQLVLTSPDYGCPQNCAHYFTYDDAVSIEECVDQPIGSNITAAYVDEVARLSLHWPGFWRDQWATTMGPYFLSFGCATVTLMKTNPVLSMDLCVEGGSFWPVKPVSYFCPITCQCSSEMMWGCPSSCALNSTKGS